MRTSHLTALSAVLALVLAAGMPRTACGQDSTRTATQRMNELLVPLGAATHARDSLSVLADKAAGEQNAVLEEQVWQRHIEIQAGLLAIAGELEKLSSQGVDLSAARAKLQDAVRSGWPSYRRQVERRDRVLQAILEERDAAPPAQRLAIETELAENSGRLVKVYRDLVEALLALERLGIDVARQRSYVTEKLSRVADRTNARMVVLRRTQALAVARVQRTPEDAGARAELDGIAAAIERTTLNLEIEISLLKRLGMDVTPLKVALIIARGKLTSAIFEPGVLAGLFRHWQQQFLDMLVTRVPHWLFEGLVIILILGASWLLARLTRFLVRRGVARAEVSLLLKDTAVSWSSRLVMAAGFVVVLRQLGLQLGPMLAGLGIASIVLGLALQDTLSNFASGAMILVYHPYDVGDIVEAGGAMGTVKKMSLVSTTVLTFDNQTLIVPNKKMWGDVIRNFTSQDKRRVDLTIAVGYENDVATVERLLQEIVDGDVRVLKDPGPVVKLHQLAESSVDFVVRAWTLQENYWDVYWDITRAVKLRFDQEGIKFPFPQREVHVNLVGGRLDRPADENPGGPVE
jgi:small conductance mechanosensitive channel